MFARSSRPRPNHAAAAVPATATSASPDRPRSAGAAAWALGSHKDAVEAKADAVAAKLVSTTEAAGAAAPQQAIRDRPANSPLRAPGEALDSATQARFGAHFSGLGGVRVHAGSEGANAAGALHAQAFAVGTDIGFAAGHYAPHTPRGRLLLAHELAHLAQGAEDASVIRRKPVVGSQDGHTVVAPPQVPRPSWLGDGKAKAGLDEKQPAWADPDSGVALPGERVPGFYGPGHKYTRADRDKLQQALKVRNKANRVATGAFLKEYVNAAITIMGRYVKGSVKEKDQVSAFLKFVVSQSLASLAGGMGSRVGKAGLEFLISKATDFGVSDALEDDETFDDEKNLDKLMDTIGRSTGELVDGMVQSLDDSAVDRGVWLGDAQPDQYHLFRIPELFISPPRDKIRGTVAGMVGAAHHRRVIGGQMGSGLQWLQVNDVDVSDHNVIVVHVGISLGKPKVLSARINSRNKELAKEIVGKVDIGTLSAMALHVTVDPTADRLNPAAQIMKAMRHPAAVAPDDVLAFERAYPKNGGTFSFTRNTKGDFATDGEGTLADHLALYQFATGDHDLQTLSERFNGTESDDESKTTRPQNHSPEELARSAYMAFKSTEPLAVGAQGLTAGVVNRAIPSA